MRIAEIYRSVQGEGLFTGKESVFVRTSGCNLRCWFCDTPYASWEPEGDDRGVPEIVEGVLGLGAGHVVLTGGEPMLFAEMIPLCEQLSDQGRHVTIETAGTLHLPVQCDLMSISPKLSNSTPSLEKSPKWHARHDRSRRSVEVVTRLMHEYHYQLKFVVNEPSDCDEILSYLAPLNAAPEQVYLMPQGIIQSGLDQIGAWLEPWCVQHGFRFCPRKHIEWFGAVRGT